MMSPATSGGFWQQVLDQLLYADVLTKGPDVLVLLAATVLVYRTFREKYLFPWVLGWAAYLAYRLLSALPAIRMVPEIILLSQLCYVAAVTGFSLAVLQYVRKKSAEIWILGLALVAICAVAMRAIWGDSRVLLVAVIVTTAAICWIAALQLVLFASGRRQFGAWLMVPMLCVLHLDANPGRPHGYSGLDVAIELLLGLSMLIIVLDHSRERTERLSLINGITNMVARTHESGTLVVSALEQLKKHTGASCAWYRYMLQDKLLIQQQIGLTERYVSSRRVLKLDESHAGAFIHAGAPGTFLPSESDTETASLFGEMHVAQVVVVPVKGKNTVTGTINLGLPRKRVFLPEELAFLSSIADQLGIGLENQHMFEQVVRSQRQWVSTFDSIDDIILVHDDAGRIMRTNRALLQRLGKKINEVIHEPLGSVLPNVPPKIHCPYCNEQDEGYMEGPDPCFGGYSLVSTSSYSEGGTAGLGTIHIVKDTTERRAAEERYRLLFEEVGEGVYITTGDGRILEMNDAFVRMLGYDDRRELLNAELGKKVYQKPEDRQRIIAEIQAKNLVRNFETNLVRKDGSTLTVLENGFGTRDASGKVVRYQGFVVDITEQKRIENEIKRRNRELNALNTIAVIAAQSFDLDEILNVTLRQVSDLFGAEMGSVWIANPETMTLHVRAWVGSTSLGAKVPEMQMSQELLDVLIANRPEFLTMEHLGLLPPVAREHLNELGIQTWVWVLLWVSGRPLGVIGLSSRTVREYTAMDRNLMVAIARQLATTIDKVRLYEETTRAYEDLRRTQEQLLQSEKMSAVGQLISGVAHELNNPLTAIVGYAQLLEQEPLSARSLDFVQKLYKQTQRTRRVVQNLLSFARQRKPLKQDVDLRRVIDETLALRDYDLKLNNIRVERDFSEAFPHVIADSHQLEQVFLNIINNAVDAMLEGGRGGALRVSAGIDFEHDAALVEFRDSGPGIKEPKRIFDPFYTTKVVGKGTGLGLSICYGIVKEHGGDITAFNHAEGGAIFQVRLPLTAKAREPQVQAPIISSDALRGKVLAVDDEEAVLELERELITGAGADVTCASDGAEAIRLLGAESFDAIVIDSKMPGEYDSPDVYRWVLVNHPELAARFVFTVSHATEPTVRGFLEEHSITHIEKPFQVSELIGILRRILASRKAETVRGAS
ncbi:multi-sensor hybrid histidine kinase [Candidatus Koribacter versatilis Ellin345]|uniref:histidine kinase n=1 Tax=Koribacter versatilis (strain Ellin345) TaxID=204669 RepID=Q1INQ2_KORVE|nr:PAS domain S-box protein [Candidatus Koribacter versatilis]ABF41498.1 multi-sensor hybrid histidine kinase [Candidatus Koribacter versatilis Ellin345]